MNNEPEKEVISISEMAARMGISRQRLFQLYHAGICPFPVYDIYTKQPCYPRLLQEQCLLIRRTNMGMNGRQILFRNTRRLQAVPVHKPVKTPRVPKKPKASPTAGQTTPGTSTPANDFVDLLAELGLNISSQQTSDALKVLFPEGTTGLDAGEIIKHLVRHFKK